VGHEEFVGDDTSPVNDDDVSDAAAAARRAGWGDGTGDESSRSESGGRRDRTARSAAEQRQGARDRRRRERAARERVDRESQRTAGATSQDAASGTAATTDGGSRAASGGSPGGVGETARSWNGSAASASASDTRRASDGGWSPRGSRSPSWPSSMVLYPLMLFSALFPPFPLLVNVIVGCCTIFLVGYLQSRPGVRRGRFRHLEPAGPPAFVAVGLPLTGLVGIAGLTGTWLPLGLSVATLVLVRP